MAKKKSTQKVPAASSRKAPTLRGTRSTKAVAASDSPSKRRPAPKPKAVKGKTFPIFCGECFSEYAVAPSPEIERLVCPVCGHACRMPESDFWSKYAERLSAQRKFAALGISLTFLALFLMIGWLVLQTNLPLAIQFGLVGEDGKLDTLNMIGLGGSGLLWLIVAIMAYLHEKNIYRAYF